MEIALYEPPKHVVDFLRANPDGVHADHRDHARFALVWDREGVPVRAIVRWISPVNCRACVLVVDREGFREVDADTGEELEQEINARGWRYQIHPSRPVVTVRGDAPESPY